MLFEQFQNVILEYKQDITAKKMGEPLIQRFMADADNNPAILTPTTKKIVDAIQNIELGPLFNKPDPDKPAPTEEEKEKEAAKLAILKNQLAVSVLTKLEEADPTRKNNYVQWLARTYSNSNVALEDVVSTVADYLDKFHRLKIKRHLTNADIGQYKDFEIFFDEMDAYSNDLIDDDEGKKKEWNADKIYDEDGILIIHPKDEAAACRYGKGTRWCTSATRGHNYFKSYNKRGNLYIFVPRKPDHAGEKYQFHFEDRMFMDEKDDPIRGAELLKLVERFPALKTAFSAQAEQHGLIWLQKPKRIAQGENFKLEEYRKNNRPFYLLKPTDGDGEMYAIQQNAQGTVSGEWPTRGEWEIGIPGQNMEVDPMNLIDQHDFYNKFPDVAKKFGMASKNIDMDPATNVTDKLEIETHNNNLIMTDPVTGIKSAIVNGHQGHHGDARKDKAYLKIISSNPFGEVSPEGVYTAPESPNILQLNPYEFTKDHPELIDMYAPIVKNLLADTEKAIKNDPTASTKEKKEKQRQAYIDVAPYLPYKVYDKADAYIKSHVDYQGRPVVDYITSKADEDGNYTIIERDPESGEVLTIKQAESQLPRDIKYSRSDNKGEMYDKQGQVIGNVVSDPNLKRLYDEGDTLKEIGFLPSLSFLDQFPGVRELYPNSKMTTPKTVKGVNDTIADYGKTVPAGKGTDSYRQSHLPTVKNMRNFIARTDNSVNGDSYAISWSPELPQYAEVYYSDNSGKQTKVGSGMAIRNIIQSIPELAKLQQQDYEKLLDSGDYNPEQFSAHASGGGSRRYRNGQLLPDYTFSPDEVIDNKRVEVKQFGPAPDQTHSLPTFEVFPKEKNPFGEIGDRFFVMFSLKDQRGKYGKISNINITRRSKVPFNAIPDEEDRTVAGMREQQSSDKDLNPKNITDFFQYYPELRRLVKAENIHPKNPHPALANEPPPEDEEEGSSTTGTAYGNFNLESVTTNDPEIKKYYIVPDETEYTGEYYTMYVTDPVSGSATTGLGLSNYYAGNTSQLTNKSTGRIIIAQGEPENRSYYGEDTVKTELQGLLRNNSHDIIISGTPQYNALLNRLPDLKQIIPEIGKEIGDVAVQTIDEDQVTEFGQNRVYAFDNKDGSKFYVITPINNPLRGSPGDYEDHIANDHPVRTPYDGEYSDEDKWNDNSYNINFASTETNPNLRVQLLIEPFKDKIVNQLAQHFKSGTRSKTNNVLSADAIENLQNGEEPESMNVFNHFAGATSVQSSGSTTTRDPNEYIQDAKTNPELYSYFQDLAEKRNAETSGIGEFINFLPLTSDQMTDAQTDVPKLHGIDLVGIAKIGITNPLYIWQGRREIFSKLEYYASNEESKSAYNLKNTDYKEAMLDTMDDRNTYNLTDMTFALKPESGGKFIDQGNSRQGRGRGTFMQMPHAVFLNLAPVATNLDKIVKPKEQKSMGMVPTRTWTPRALASMPEKPIATNDGKPWVKSVQEFIVADGLGYDISHYGGVQPTKFLPPGTAYLITLNPISSEEGPRKRKDGKLVRVPSPHNTVMQMTRGMDLPWEFRHYVLGDGRGASNKFLLYFANNRVAYILEPGGGFSKYNMNQEQKKNLFFGEYGLFPELKPILNQYAKSNKWLKENRLMHDVLLESFGDLAYWKLQKEKNKEDRQKMKTIWDSRPWPFKGSYTNQQLKDLGFKRFDKGWKVSQAKYDELANVKEMIDRPLVTGNAKIPNVGKKKIAEEEVSEGKKFPRTSEFLYKKVDALEDIKQLAGVYQPVEEGDGSMGSNISKTANKISTIMKDKNIQPGTPEWFQLWFSKPYLTGEKPTGD